MLWGHEHLRDLRQAYAAVVSCSTMLRQVVTGFAVVFVVVLPRAVCYVFAASCHA